MTIQQPKICFCCGTTGGHIYPIIALAKEINDAIFFIGTQTREDSKIIPKYGFRYLAILSNKKKFLSILKNIWTSFIHLKKDPIHLINTLSELRLVFVFKKIFKLFL